MGGDLVFPHFKKKKREEKNRRRGRREAAPEAPRERRGRLGPGAGDNNTGLKLTCGSELQFSLVVCAPWRGEGDRAYFRGAGTQVVSNAILKEKTQGKLKFFPRFARGQFETAARRLRGRRVAVGMIDGMLCACRCSSPVESRIIDQPTRLAVGRSRRVIRVQTAQSRRAVSRVARAMASRRRARARPARRRIPRGGHICQRSRPCAPGLGA